MALPFQPNDLPEALGGATAGPGRQAFHAINRGALVVLGLIILVIQFLVLALDALHALFMSWVDPGPPVRDRQLPRLLGGPLLLVEAAAAGLRVVGSGLGRGARMAHRTAAASLESVKLLVSGLELE